MKITKSYLAKLIKEEVGNLYKEEDEPGEEQQPEQPQEEDWEDELKAKVSPKQSPFDEKSYWDEEKDWRGFEPQESEEEIKERDVGYAKVTEYLETLNSKIDSTMERVDRVTVIVQKQLEEIKAMFGEEAAKAEDEEEMFEKEYEKDKQQGLATGQQQKE